MTASSRCGDTTTTRPDKRCSAASTGRKGGGGDWFDVGVCSVGLIGIVGNLDPGKADPERAATLQI